MWAIVAPAQVALPISKTRTFTKFDSTSLWYTIFMNLKDTYNLIAEDWFKDHRDDTWWVATTDRLIRMLKLGSTILDVGCGAGVKAKYLQNHGLSVTGIDFSEKFIEIAHREVPGAQFQILDMRNVAELGKLFDCVFAQACLLHIPKKETGEVIRKFVEVLNPGGYLYIAVKGIPADGKEEKVLEENDYGYSYSRFFSFYTMEEIVNHVEAAGLKLIFQNDELNGKTRWLQVIAQKK